MIVAEDAAPGSAEEGENYFVSMTDMMIGVLFIFIIMLMVFALNYRSSTDTLEAEKLVAEKLVAEQQASQQEEAKRIAEDRAQQAEEAKRIAEDRAQQPEEAKRIAEDRAQQPEEAKRIAEDRARQPEEAKRLAGEQARRLRLLEENAIHVAQDVARRLEELRDEVHAEISNLDRARYARLHLLEDIKAQLQAEGLNVQIDERSGVLRLTEEAVQFAVDSSILPDTPDNHARTNVGKIARVLDRVLPSYAACRASAQHSICKDDPGPTVETVFIEGHTDSTGRDERNWQLSTERAVNTYREMVAKAPSLRALRNRDMNEIISVSGYASTRPLGSGDSTEARAKNRRIDLRFVMEVDSRERLREVLGLTDEMQKQIERLRQLSGR